MFDAEHGDKREATQIKVFHALFAFGSNIEEYMHLIIPIIVKTIEKTDASTMLRSTAIKCIDGLSRKVNFSDHASRIIHPLVRVLSDPNSPPELRPVVMETLCALLIQLGSDFAIFAPMINKVFHLSKHFVLGLTLYAPVSRQRTHYAPEVRYVRLSPTEWRTTAYGVRNSGPVSFSPTLFFPSLTRGFSDGSRRGSNLGQHPKTPE